MIPKHMNRRTAVTLVVASLVVVGIGGALLARGGSISPSSIFGGSSPRSSSPTASIGVGSRPGSTTSTSAVIGRDRTKQRVAPSRTADYSVPAADGVVLETITVPPAKTLAMVSPDAATANSAYDVVFRAYGWGPSTASIPTAVVLVTGSTPVGEVSTPFAFKGRSVLVRLDPESAKALTRGGSYSGTITLRLMGDALIPWLGDVGPAS